MEDFVKGDRVRFTQEAIERNIPPGAGRHGRASKRLKTHNTHNGLIPTPERIRGTVTGRPRPGVEHVGVILDGLKKSNPFYYHHTYVTKEGA
jgi:hypothetical protein